MRCKRVETSVKLTEYCIPVPTSLYRTALRNLTAVWLSTMKGGRSAQRVHSASKRRGRAVETSSVRQKRRQR
eukprot:4598008-Pleurochrysis_carterae.AAC.1